MIDSIAAVFRADDSPDDPYGKVDRGAEYAARAKSMLALAARLKQLSHRYNLAVIVTNQVADKPAEALDERRLSPWERGASLAEGSLHDGLRLPALGISWATSAVEPGCTPLSQGCNPVSRGCNPNGAMHGAGPRPHATLMARPPVRAGGPTASTRGCCSRAASRRASPPPRRSTPRRSTPRRSTPHRTTPHRRRAHAPRRHRARRTTRTTARPRRTRSRRHTARRRPPRRLTPSGELEARPALQP